MYKLQFFTFITVLIIWCTFLLHDIFVSIANAALFMNIRLSLCYLLTYIDLPSLFTEFSALPTCTCTSCSVCSGLVLGLSLVDYSWPGPLQTTLSKPTVCSRQPSRTCRVDCALSLLQPNPCWYTITFCGFSEERIGEFGEIILIPLVPIPMPLFPFPWHIHCHSHSHVRNARLGMRGCTALLAWSHDSC